MVSLIQQIVLNIYLVGASVSDAYVITHPEIYGIKELFNYAHRLFESRIQKGHQQGIFNLLCDFTIFMASTKIAWMTGVWNTSIFKTDYFLT